MNTTVQYTLRGIPSKVDAELRREVRRQGRSLNAIAVEALARGAGLGHDPVFHDDLDDLAGTWVEDPAFDQAIRDMDRIDPHLWK